MEFGIVIPAAAEKVIKANPAALKKCQHCKFGCDTMTKFFCLGLDRKEIVAYIKKHPTFAEQVTQKFIKECEQNKIDISIPNDIDLSL